jgi:D-glycerate 3-kinase
MQNIDENLISTFLEKEQLPESFRDIINNWYLPLLNRLLVLHQQQGPGLLVGINGAQGTGKSTLTKLLTLVLQQQNLNVANVSLDDFYLSHQRRAELARQVHPLLATRGVPGTHDLILMQQLFNKMTDSEISGNCHLPRFDKALDNPKAETEWETINLPVDLILFEGWFVGLTPQEENELIDPVNSLETDLDTQAIWRRHVNQQLHDYQPLFNSIDFLIMLKAPSFDCVYKWRSLQEEKLAAAVSQADNKVMDQATLQRFIQHFERLTCHGLQYLPTRADLVFNLDDQQQITSMSQAVH